MNRLREFGILRIALVPILCVALCNGAFAASTKHKRHKSHKRAPTTQQQSLTVSATAYNATLAQTDGNPIEGAWGDHLDEIPAGFRAIAVSPDLAEQGLTHRKRVRIQGFKGEFLVLDRTPPQWRNTIDIFMGTDVQAARLFGRKHLKIYWSAPKPKATASSDPQNTPEACPSSAPQSPGCTADRDAAPRSSGDSPRPGRNP